MKVNNIFIQIEDNGELSFLEDILREINCIKLATNIELHLEKGIITIAISKGKEWLNENQISTLNESLNRLKKLATSIVKADVSLLNITD